ncbi:MAG: hypothetical protein HY264_02320 [Chloroflexi bacterium]|nr:hypothetical protein [Chloroflexota bacterium]
MNDDEEVARRRRGPMSRIGDLIPSAAARLGLADELRRARAVEADAPIVAQELRLHARQLLEAFRSAPAGARVDELRVTIRGRGPSPGG